MFAYCSMPYIVIILSREAYSSNLEIEAATGFSKIPESVYDTASSHNSESNNEGVRFIPQFQLRDVYWGAGYVA
jgi:hypothetical protein